MEKIDSKSSDVGVEAIENVKVQSSATPMSSMLAKMLLNLKSDSQPSLMSPLPDLTPAISNIVEATHISEASNAKVKAYFILMILILHLNQPHLKGAWR